MLPGSHFAQSESWGCRDGHDSQWVCQDLNPSWPSDSVCAPVSQPGPPWQGSASQAGTHLSWLLRLGQCAFLEERLTPGFASTEGK